MADELGLSVQPLVPSPLIISSSQDRIAAREAAKRKRTTTSATLLELHGERPAVQASKQHATTGPLKGSETDIPTGEIENPFGVTDLAFSKIGSVELGEAKGLNIDPTHRNISPNDQLTHRINDIAQGDEIQLRMKPLSASVQQFQPRPRKTHTNRRSRDETASIPADAMNENRLSQRVRSWYGQQVVAVKRPSMFCDAEAAGKLGHNSGEICMVDEYRNDPSSRTDEPEKLGWDRKQRSHGCACKCIRGIEDWTDLDGIEVDRYGFYSAKALSSKRLSSAAGPDPAGRRLRPIVDDGKIAQDGSSRRTPSPQASQSVSTNYRKRLSLLRPPSQQFRATKRASILGLPLSTGRRHFEAASEMLAPTIAKTCGLEDQADSISISLTDHALERRRALKWARMARPIKNLDASKGGGMDFGFDVHSAKLISRTWKGIPDCWRGAAWYAFLSESAAKGSVNGKPEPSDASLEIFFRDCQNRDCEDDVQIDLDVPRTVGAHVVFRQRYQGGQRFLFRVLRALSMYFPKLGYVQGMASLIATLLNYYTEDRAFVMAVRMWMLRGVYELYEEGFAGLMAAFDDLEQNWMKDNLVSKQLKDYGISISGWGPKWYLTLFNYVLPFPAQLRIWDAFMLLGTSHGKGATSSPSTGKQLETPANLDVLHAASSAILSALHDKIVYGDFESAMRALTAPIPISNADALMNVARRNWQVRSKRR